MKLVETEVLIDKGPFSSGEEWVKIQNQIKEAIKAVDWPPGSGSFTILKESGKKRGKGSGVTPIKKAFMATLKTHGWKLETRINIATVKIPGPVDATCNVGDRLFAVEWETGNISSSHRALNKMAFGIFKKILIGGILVLPTREFYQYLTDRVGNFSELVPFFPFWKAYPCEEGFLAVMAIEYDHVSNDVPRIPKKTDGRALG
jgi:hypothetical protein